MTDTPLTLEERNEKMVEHIVEQYAEDYSEAAAEAFRTNGSAYVDETGQPVAPSEATEYLSAWPGEVERPPIPFALPIVHDPPDGYWMRVEMDGTLDFYINPMTGDMKGVPADE